MLLAMTQQNKTLSEKNFEPEILYLVQLTGKQSHFQRKQ